MIIRDIRTLFETEKEKEEKKKKKEDNERLIKDGQMRNIRIPFQQEKEED